jgi:hypothetical protein
MGILVTPFALVYWTVQRVIDSWTRGEELGWGEALHVAKRGVAKATTKRLNAHVFAIVDSR